MSDEAARSESPETQALVEEALRSLWAVANSLARIGPPRSDRFRVTIFGSSRVWPGQPLYEDVKLLAGELSRLGCDIVTGGGPGLMQAANEGAVLGDPDDRTRSIGVRIDLSFEQAANPFVEQLYTHQSFFTRLHHFARLSSAFVVVGGGIGTLLETVLVWQLLQVRHAVGVPLVLVGPMWRDLVAWARAHMLAHDPPFANPGDFALPICVPSVADAIEQLRPVLARHRAGAKGA
ncbi:MAG: LOG family protein [Deltaproteobacteria bacterium]|nr:LOG family protein [Deltaproteobacteria bacterium]